MKNVDDSRDQQQGIQSLEIGLQMVLRLVSPATQQMSLSEICRRTGMPASKAHRYLVSLIREGLLKQDVTTGRYDLGQTAIELGLAARSRLDPVRAAERTLRELHLECRLPVAATIWTDHGPVMVRKEESYYPLVIGTRVGSIQHITNSASGRAFAAFGQSSLVAPLLEREFAAGAAIYNGVRIGKPAFKRLVRDIQARGLASQRGDLFPGVEGIAAPVFDWEGHMNMCLSMTALVGDRDVNTESSKLLKAASELSRRLGHATNF